MVREVTLDDSNQLCEIYNYYILNTIATFEINPIDNAEMQNRIKNIKSKFPFIVYEEKGKILGYAYSTDWKTRSAYKFTVESSIYLKNSEIGKGLGFILYSELINLLKKIDIHSVIGGIALPNLVSIALHEKFGFEKIAHFKEVGFKFNKWVDVAYWELIIPKTYKKTLH